MTWDEYINHSTALLLAENPEAPYDDVHFLEYTKLNISRMNRWIKTGKLNEELVSNIEKINTTQHWEVIAEPWCGDAAHITPFLYLISQKNNQIKINFQLRDSNSEIDSYLTNGSKSIPILIVRDENNQDIFVWGPRPKNCQEMFLQLKEKNLPMEEQKVILQQWYNDDKGVSFQKEWLEMFAKL